MKVIVSETVRRLLGRRWRSEVRLLVESAMIPMREEGDEQTEAVTVVNLRICIAVDQDKAVVTAQPDLLPERQEVEMRI